MKGWLCRLNRRLRKYLYERLVQETGPNVIWGGDRIELSGGRQSDAGGGLWIGEDTHIYNGCRLMVDIVSPASAIRIGARCAINYDAYFDGSGGIQMGDDCLLGPRVSIFSSNHGFESVCGLIREQPKSFSRVEIGDNVWIGAHVVILAGSRIGSNCVIAAGSVVKGELSSGAIYGGVPVKLIRRIDGYH